MTPRMSYTFSASLRVTDLNQLKISRASGSVSYTHLDVYKRQVRQRVCQGLGCLGVVLDEAANRALKGEGTSSAPDSRVLVRVIPANEELMVVRGVVACLEDRGEESAP